MKKVFNEPELPDDYPVYNGYLYVVNGVVRRAFVPEGGSTVGEMKERGVANGAESVKSVTRCDIVARGLTDEMV